MKQQWQEWQNKINGLNQRERILQMVTILAVIIMFFQMVLIDPAFADSKKARSQLQAVKLKLQQQESEKQLIEAQLIAGVNRHKENRKQQLMEEIAQLDIQIEQSVVAMIPPRLMPQVLEKILQNNHELKLVSLENKLVVPVIDAGDDSADGANVGKRRSKAATQIVTANGKQGLYSHGFILTLSGNYMAAIRYFDELSKLPWQFYWDSLSYQVDSYPNATIKLEVHTVSMSEEWIGV